MLKLLRLNVTKPSINKLLIDDFYSLKNLHNDINYDFLIDQVIDYTKNCHNITPVDTLNKIDFTIRKRILEEPDLSAVEVEALRNILNVLSLHHKEMLF